MVRLLGKTWCRFLSEKEVSPCKRIDHCYVFAGPLRRRLTTTDLPMNRIPQLLLISLSMVTRGLGQVDFAHQVVPVLREHCAKCHMKDAKKGGFSMNTRESLL